MMNQSMMQCFLLAAIAATLLANKFVTTAQSKRGQSAFDSVRVLKILPKKTTCLLTCSPSQIQ
jgi:hypothetical protein